MLAQASIHRAGGADCHIMRPRFTMDAGLRQHDKAGMACRDFP
jgi:hypothetical protein